MHVASDTTGSGCGLALPTMVSLKVDVLEVGSATQRRLRPCQEIFSALKQPMHHTLDRGTDILANIFGRKTGKSHTAIMSRRRPDYGVFKK